MLLVARTDRAIRAVGGDDALAETVAAYTPERAAQICGVDASVLWMRHVFATAARVLRMSISFGSVSQGERGGRAQTAQHRVVCFARRVFGRAPSRPAATLDPLAARAAQQTAAQEAAKTPDAVRGLLERSGFAYRYPPPYSPDLNPIEDL